MAVGNVVQGLVQQQPGVAGFGGAGQRGGTGAGSTARAQRESVVGLGVLAGALACRAHLQGSGRAGRLQPCWLQTLRPSPSRAAALPPQQGAGLRPPPSVTRPSSSPLSQTAAAAAHLAKLLDAGQGAAGGVDVGGAGLVVGALQVAKQTVGSRQQAEAAGGSWLRWRRRPWQAWRPLAASPARPLSCPPCRSSGCAPTRRCWSQTPRRPWRLQSTHTHTRGAAPGRGQAKVQAAGGRRRLAVVRAGESARDAPPPLPPRLTWQQGRVHHVISWGHQHQLVRAVLCGGAGGERAIVFFFFLMQQEQLCPALRAPARPPPKAAGSRFLMKEMAPQPLPSTTTRVLAEVHDASAPRTRTGQWASSAAWPGCAGWVGGQAGGRWVPPAHAAGRVHVPPSPPPRRPQSRNACTPCRRRMAGERRRQPRQEG